MASLVSFWSIFGNGIVNFGLIDFKLGLYIKVNVNAGKNKFEVHIQQFGQNGHQLAKNRPDATLAQLGITWSFVVQFSHYFFLNACFLRRIEW